VQALVTGARARAWGRSLVRVCADLRRYDEHSALLAIDTLSNAFRAAVCCGRALASGAYGRCLSPPAWQRGSVPVPCGIRGAVPSPRVRRAGKLGEFMRVLEDTTRALELDANCVNACVLRPAPPSPRESGAMPPGGGPVVRARRRGPGEGRPARGRPGLCDSCRYILRAQAKTKIGGKLNVEQARRAAQHVQLLRMAQREACGTGGTASEVEQPSRCNMQRATGSVEDAT
jgi:hypothetical protein